MNRFVNIAVAALLTFVAVAGCSEKGTVSVVCEAARTDTLNLRMVRLSKELFAPTRMTVSDGRVFMFQRKGDTLFTVIPEPLSGICYAGGIKGRGPDEFIGVDVQSISPCAGGLICIDAGGKVKRISVGKGCVEVADVSAVNTEGCPQNGIITPYGYISANVMNDRSEFIIYKDGCRPDYAGQYPEWTSVDKAQLPFAYMKNLIAHPSGQLFAAFYVYFRKFRIYDTAGNLVKDVDVNAHDRFLQYSTESSDPYLAYASYPSAAEECVYALCCNRKVSERGVVLPEIHVFGWDGRFRQKIVPDRHIDLFAIDDKNGIFYGFDADGPDILYYAPLRP